MINVNASNNRPRADHAHSDGVNRASLKKNPAAPQDADAGAKPAAAAGPRLNRHGEEIPRHASEAAVRPGPDGAGEVPVSLQTSPRNFEAGMLSDSQRFPRGNFEENHPVFTPQAQTGSAEASRASGNREATAQRNTGHPHPIQDEPHSVSGRTVHLGTAVPKHLSTEEKQQMRRLQGNRAFIHPETSGQGGAI